MSQIVMEGDCRTLLAGLAAASVDAVVTDPPYELGFMGRTWDRSGVAFDPDTWAAVRRVMRPGAHALIFGGTRTWHRIAIAVEDAGFELRDSIAWMYGQGFPKAKGVLKPAFEPIILARNPFRGSERANMAEHGTGALNIDACRLPTSDRWTATGRQSAAGVALMGSVDASLNVSVSSTHEGGRWPPNVILDGIQASELGERSRFMYVAKASGAERPQVNGVSHPTVKPLALTRWLVRLVTPPGGTVLDPFAGSGTTAEAAALEDMSSISMESDPQYLPLIQHRLDRVRT